MRVLSVRVTREDRAALSKLAKVSKCNKSSLVRQLIREESRRRGLLPAKPGRAA